MNTELVETTDILVRSIDAAIAKISRPLVAFAVEGGPPDNFVGIRTFAGLRKDEEITLETPLLILTGRSATMAERRTTVALIPRLVEGGNICLLDKPIGVEMGEVAFVVTQAFRKMLKGKLETPLREESLRNSEDSILIGQLDEIKKQRQAWLGRLRLKPDEFWKEYLEKRDSDIQGAKEALEKMEQTLAILTQFVIDFSDEDEVYSTHVKRAKAASLLFGQSAVGRVHTIFLRYLRKVGQEVDKERFNLGKFHQDVEFYGK